MPESVQEIIQRLNQEKLQATAWILWHRTAEGSFRISSQFGFETDSLEQLTDQWDGHTDLLEQVFATQTPRRAVADRKQVDTTETKTTALNLLLTPVVSRENELVILELFYPHSEQADATMQRDSFQQTVTQIGNAIRLSPNDHRSENQNELAAYLSELVAETSPEDLPHAIATAICIKYEIDRCSFFVSANDDVHLLGISGHRDYESRAETIEQLHKLIRSSADSLSADENSITISGDQLNELKSQAAIVVRLGTLPRTEKSFSQNNLMLLEFFGKKTESEIPDLLAESLPLWKLALQPTFSKPLPFLRARKTKKLFSLLLVIVVCLLFFFPVPLKIHSPGQLIPKKRQHLFAPEAGLIKAENLHLPEQHNIIVNQHLLTISNQELNLQSSQLEGKIATMAEEIRSLKSRRPARETEPRFHPTIDQDLSIRLAEAKVRLKGFEQEKVLLDQRIASLKIRSPHSGTLLSWDAEHQLAGRPVSQGQLLLTIGKMTGDWEVLAEVSQHDLGVLKKMMQENKGKLSYTITLDSSPTRQWEGNQIEVSPIVHQQKVGEFTLPVKGEISSSVENVRPGSRVTLHISCGNYPLGYVLFRGLIDTVRGSLTW